MASFSLISITTQALTLIVLLQLSSLFDNLAAKHSHNNKNNHHNNKNHRHHNDTPTAPDSNPRLEQAYRALQAWKRAIYSDPNNFTTNWVGPAVCLYTGVFCTLAIDDNRTRVVAGIDLNHADIAGFLPPELGLLTDLALIHLNSNRFCGVIPPTLSNLSLLYELDLSNNRFVGPFPSVVLSLPSLNYLDLRYNNFEGPLPPQLYAKKLDAVFLNNNRFTTLNLPTSLPGNATAAATVLVFANNNYGGHLPPSIVQFADTLEELILTNTNLSGCLPQEVGFLYKLKVFDVSSNEIVGPIPYSMAGLYHLEQLNLAHNKLSGAVLEGLCTLPNLSNFTISYNFFCEEDDLCRNLSSKKGGKPGGLAFDDRRNCLPERRFQRSEKECKAALERPVECAAAQGGSGATAGASAKAVAVSVDAAGPVAHSPAFAPAST